MVVKHITQEEAFQRARDITESAGAVGFTAAVCAAIVDAEDEGYTIAIERLRAKAEWATTCNYETMAAYFLEAALFLETADEQQPTPNP